MSNHNNNISSFENANKYSNENISISIHNDDNIPNSSSNPFPTPPAENDGNKLVKNNEKDVEKMAKEGWYIFNNSDVMEKSLECEQWIHQYNQSLALPLDERVALLRQRLGHVGKGVRVKPPFFCYMGSNIHLADGVFMNFNCHLLDGAPIEIGENTMFGTCVKIIAVDHPRDPQLREAEWEWAKPIRIGRNCWIGTGTTILQGVTIGDNCIVGANSVVNKDVPANSTVAGAPARIIVKKEKDGN